jgi:hypothetical protein
MIKLEDQSITVHLSDEGRRVLKQAGWDAPESPSVQFDVQASTEQGLWVRLEAAGRRYVVMIRWDYILAVIVDVGEVRTEGLVH